MNIWAIVLYVLEALTLGGVVIGLSQGKKGPIPISNAGGVFGLFIAALGFFAIYMLTMQSSAENAVTLGVIYAIISALALPSFFSSWARGSTSYTSRRALLVTIAGVAGIVLTTMLAFAG